MRVRLNNTLISNNNTTCGLSGYGEVEDYSIKVTPTNDIGSSSHQKDILLYPNPVLNVLNVEIEGSSEKTCFEILNSMGQAVYKSSLVDKTVVDLSKGFYLIKFETGESVLMRKFVKE